MTLRNCRNGATEADLRDLLSTLDTDSAARLTYLLRGRLCALLARLLPAGALRGAAPASERATLLERERPLERELLLERER